MINEYDNIEQLYYENIAYIVFYSKGALSYEDAWMLSRAEFKQFEEVIQQGLKLLTAAGGIGGML